MIVYWLLGATDAHAKNFSLALRPGGGFRLAPFYDVVSLQPHFDRGELRRNQLRFAVALGNRRHTVLDKIDGRHFAQIEKAAGLPVGIAQDVAAEIVDRSRGAVDRVRDELSDTVGADLMSSILGGYHQRLQRLEAWIDG
jgi:serine/threonine-protein kinase HipA